MQKFSLYLWIYTKSRNWKKYKPVGLCIICFLSILCSISIDFNCFFSKRVAWNSSFSYAEWMITTKPYRFKKKKKDLPFSWFFVPDVNQERWTVFTQSKQKEAGSMFPFSLVCCCPMSAAANVSAPPAGSIFLPNADSSACCYVFCLHSKFPGCLSQVIASLAGPASLLQDTPKSWGLRRSVGTGSGTAGEAARQYHSGWKGLVRSGLCLRPHAYRQV